MHDNMRDFTVDIEENLQKAYQNIPGGLKKFGFETSLTYRSLDGEGNADFKPAIKIEREIEKMN